MSQQAADLHSLNARIELWSTALNPDSAGVIQSIIRQTQSAEARRIAKRLAAVPSGAGGSSAQDAEQDKTKASGAAKRASTRKKASAQAKADAQQARERGNTRKGESNATSKWTPVAHTRTRHFQSLPRGTPSSRKHPRQRFWRTIRG